MYKPQNSASMCLQTKLINETMMYVVLTNIAHLAGNDDERLFEKFLDIRDRERNPEVIIAYMEKYKADIMIGLAEDENSKPKGFSTEEAFDLYVKTVKFLSSKELSVPSLDVEYVIGTALEEDYENYYELFDNAAEHYRFKEKDSLGVSSQYKPVKTWDDFEKYVLDFSKFIGGTEKEAKECRYEFEEYMKELQSSEPEDFKMFYPNETEFIYHCLDLMFNPQEIIEYSFYDIDYALLREMTIDDIKASPINDYFGIVATDENEINM